MKLLKVKCRDAISFSFSVGGYKWKFQQVPYHDWYVSTRSKTMKNVEINIGVESVNDRSITADFLTKNELEKDWLPSMRDVELHDVGTLKVHAEDPKEKAKYAKLIDEMKSMRNISLDVYREFSRLWNEKHEK